MEPKMNVYRVTTARTYLIIAESEEDAADIFREEGGDWETEDIEDIEFVGECDC